MSIKSQTNNMRRLAALLNFNLCNIRGKKECGPNGSKQVFLNVGKVFLRALARDLGLHDVTVSSNAGGIGVRPCFIILFPMFTKTKGYAQAITSCRDTKSFQR